MEAYGLKLDVNEFLDSPVSYLDDLKSNSSSMRSIFEVFILKVQKEVCSELERLENLNQNGKETRKFRVDSWKREENGGGGISCVFQDGVVFEKAGVNVSVVFGLLPKEAADQMRQRGKVLENESNLNFFAAGISSVIHPKNPNVPTIHFNYRYFEVENFAKKKVWWFGGGVDMTPFILDKQDAKHFHHILKSTCDKHNLQYYPKFKKECDEYFFIKHRKETRGIGGIFFDDMDYPNLDKAFKFVQSCAYSFIASYSPIVEKNLNKLYSPQDREWQLIRRGRYVEFNLIYDRGTKFGLFTPNARCESILMSLPLYAKWEYCHNPEKGSKEEQFLEVLKHPIDWVSEHV